MKNRPPIREICYITAEGNPHTFVVGANCSEIREVEEAAEYCFINWIEVYQSGKLIARFNQHKLESIFY